MPPNQPTPPSSTSSNGASPNTPQFRVVRKRNRIPLSCAPCRHRKLKCNRGHPCDNCTKRGDIPSCNYAMPRTRKSQSANTANQSPDDMQNRIDRLEGLVLSLMTNGQPGAAAAARAAIGTSRSNSLSTSSDLRLDVQGNDMIAEEDEDGEVDSEVEQVSKGIGVMKVDSSKIVYASDSHWFAILAEIGEVKKYFDSHKESVHQQMAKISAANNNNSPGAAFFLRGEAAMTREELIAAFPAKADSDRLIARYFNAYDPSVHIIHGPSFQKQYDAHWADPSATSVLWLGMCYAMMTLALQSYHRAADECPEYYGKSLKLSHEYRHLTAQCLTLSDITQPIPQILEMFVLHMQSEYGRSKDAEPSVLLMSSLCVRLAMRMGYHRDPAPYPGITPFQGEIRRRVWIFVRQFDLLVSFQFGMPPMIRSDMCDTQPPRNIYDDELSEDMKVLPPSRASFEATPMAYMISKSRMSMIFGRIVERVQALINPLTYEEAMKFDQELRTTRQEHPPFLQMRSFQESARDPANLIMQRIGLELMYLRSLFVLHRRFVASGRDNPRYAYSRRTCLDASMEMLAHQATLHEESQPGGRLRSVKWYISSLTTHDFLLAAVLVCIDLYRGLQADLRHSRKGDVQSDVASPGDPYEEDRRETMMQAAEHCIGIWETVRDISMEAFKASKSLRVMVDRLKVLRSQYELMRSGPTQELSQTGSKRPVFAAFPNAVMADFSKTDDLPPEQSAAMTLGMLSSGGMSPNAMFNLVQGAGTGSPGGLQDGKAFPASMAGLLNEPVQSERTGLTPQYTGPDSTAYTGAASPFSQMFGNQGAFPGMDTSLGGDIDWGAWDSYIQGAQNNAMDPASQSWSMNLDMDSQGVLPLPQQQPQPQSQSQQQQQAQTSGMPNVFMGAGTPGASNMM